MTPPKTFAPLSHGQRTLRVLLSLRLLASFAQFLHLGWGTVDFVSDFAAGLVSDDHIMPLLCTEI